MTLSSSQMADAIASFSIYTGSLILRFQHPGRIRVFPSVSVLALVRSFRDLSRRSRNRYAHSQQPFLPDGNFRIICLITCLRGHDCHLRRVHAQRDRPFMQHLSGACPSARTVQCRPLYPVRQNTRNPASVPGARASSRRSTHPSRSGMYSFSISDDTMAPMAVGDNPVSLKAPLETASISRGQVQYAGFVISFQEFAKPPVLPPCHLLTLICIICASS